MMVQRLRRSAAGGALCATLALLVAGCGGGSSTSSSNLSPLQELSKGLSSLGNSDQLTATVTLDATKQELLALNADQPRSDQISPNTAGLIAGADLVVALRTPNGATLSESGTASGAKKPANVSLKADVDNTDVFDLRGVAGALYLRANVQKITSLAGKTQADIAKLKAQIPGQLLFINAALAGKWVGISAADLKTLSKQLGAGATPPSKAKQNEFFSQLNQLVAKDVTVTRVDSGSNGDHLALSGNARTVVGDLLHAVESVAPANPAFSAFDPTSVPAKTVRLDAVVKDGTLRSLSLDLAQFASGKDAQQLAGKHLPLRVDFTKTADKISAPTDFTPVDPSFLAQLLGSLQKQG